MGLYKLFLSAYFFDPDSQEKERKKERKGERSSQLTGLMLRLTGH